MQMEMESASSPFKVSGASPSPRRQLPMSQYASAGEVSSVDSSVHGQLSHRVRNTLLQRKRQLSTLTSAVLTKIAGASTSQYDDFETAEVDEDVESASSNIDFRPAALRTAGPCPKIDSLFRCSNGSHGSARSRGERIPAGVRLLALR